MSLQALGGAKAAAVSNTGIPSLGEFNRLTGKTVVKQKQLVGIGKMPRYLQNNQF